MNDSDLAWYLATPFRRYMQEHGQFYGHQRAALDAARIWGALTARGFIVYSPVMEVSQFGDLTGMAVDDHDYWMHYCRRRFRLYDGLIIADSMPGWGESAGVAEEAAWFRTAGRPVRHYSEVVGG